MRTLTLRSALLVLASSLAGLLAGCGNSGGDKAGGETVALTLATIDGAVNGNGQAYGPEAFADSLADVSGGQLKVEITKGYGDGAASAESDLVKAIAAGEIDGGWPSTRSFAGAGITGLEVVEAPMTITNYDAEKALVSGPVADELLSRLDGSGVVGLGVAVGPLRRPFTAEAPLLEPADWEGASFRVFNSPVQNDAVRALGGTPANVGFDWTDQVAKGNLRGGEFDIAQAAEIGLTEPNNVAANVVLWPKVFVLAFSQKRWDGLSEEQQGWVREAADRAVEASIDATYDETTPATKLCESGVRFADASPGQIAKLRSALKPVLDQLATDDGSEALLTEIQTIAGEHPEPEAPAVPDSCRGAGVEDSVGSVSEQPSSLPEGDYRVAITPGDVQDAGLENGPGWSGTWTLTARGGTYELRCRPLADPGNDCGNVPPSELSDDPLEAGDIRGSDHTAQFVDSVNPVPPYRANWKIQGETLEFSDYTGDGAYLVIRPWRKIG